MALFATVDPCAALLSKAMPRVGITARLVGSRRNIPADNLLTSPEKSSTGFAWFSRAVSTPMHDPLVREIQ
jgi:hypothetical protein